MIRYKIFNIPTGIALIMRSNIWKKRNKRKKKKNERKKEIKITERFLLE